jgi:hypothetical protein
LAYFIPTKQKAKTYHSTEKKSKRTTEDLPLEIIEVSMKDDRGTTRNDSKIE